MLKDMQLRQFQKAADAFMQTAIGLENFMEHAYAFISKLVPNEFIAFGTLNLAEKNLQIGANLPLPHFAEAMQGLGSVMADYKLFNWDPSVNRGMPFKRSDFYTEREFRQTAPYCLTLKKLGVDNHCAVHVPGVTGEVSFFGIERKGGPDFSEQERLLLSLAQPLLGSGRRLAREREKLMAKTVNPAALVRAGLTFREADVLELVAKGATNAEVARELRITLDTVKEHLAHIFLKTGAGNRLAAALWALRTTDKDRVRPLGLHLPRITVPVVCLPD